MSRMDVIAGAWRNGMDGKDLSRVESIERREQAGFRMREDEAVVLELVSALEGYDALVQELLTEEPKAVEAKQRKVA